MKKFLVVLLALALVFGLLPYLHGYANHFKTRFSKHHRDFFSTPS